MIFIGPGLSNRDDHFYTNIVSSCDSEYEVIDLLLCRDWTLINESLLSIINKNKLIEKVVIYNPYTNDEFIINFRKSYPDWIVYSIFSDDEWRHFDYDRYIAIYSNCSTIAYNKHISYYHKYNIPVMYLPVCCNPDNFFPIEGADKIYDVTFIGAAYGPRLSYIKFLLKSGVKVKVFGRGWDNDVETRSSWGGWISNEQMNFVINSSKISLNFSWISADPTALQIKGRIMELACAKGFQLINANPDLKDYGFIDGLNIATFDTKEHLLDRVNFYLSNNALRDSIANMAYKLVLDKFVWKDRLADFFNKNHSHPFNEVVFNEKILVIKSHELIRHSINVNCSEINQNIFIVNKENVNNNYIDQYDYCIYLDYDSNINNDTIKLMTFALFHDSTTYVAASFYTSNTWIRLNSYKSLRGFFYKILLPNVVVMKKIKYLKDNRFDFSYIELPTLIVFLPYLYSRILISFFGHSEQIIKSYKQNKISFLALMGKIFDKLFQSVLYK